MTTINAIVNSIIGGKNIPVRTARSLIGTDLEELMSGADRLRRHFMKDTAHLCSIINAKSGRCSENCAFCAQSSHHKAEVSSYPLVSEGQIIEAFCAAKEAKARCFGIVTSGNRVSGRELDTICSAVEKIRHNGVRISASLGELKEDELLRLKKAGIGRYHHNLETSERFFPSLCSTHRYRDRVATISAAKKAGLEVCAGGLMGLGETLDDRIDLAFALRGLGVDSVPLNFLNPIPGTPLESQPRLAISEILRTIALFRYILPDRNISVCGGREVSLRDCQSWIFRAGASGMMVGGYLTTPGRPVAEDHRMLKDLGLNIDAPAQS